MEAIILLHDQLHRPPELQCAEHLLLAEPATEDVLCEHEDEDGRVADAGPHPFKG